MDRLPVLIVKNRREALELIRKPPLSLRRRTPWWASYATSEARWPEYDLAAAITNGLERYTQLAPASSPAHAQ